MLFMIIETWIIEFPIQIVDSRLSNYIYMYVLYIYIYISIYIYIYLSIYISTIYIYIYIYIIYIYIYIYIYYIYILHIYIYHCHFLFLLFLETRKNLIDFCTKFWVKQATKLLMSKCTANRCRKTTVFFFFFQKRVCILSCNETKITTANAFHWDHFWLGCNEAPENDKRTLLWVSQ